MKVVCITPTGARPEAFALCQRYMQRQSFADFMWIVLDDCDPQTNVTDPRAISLRPQWRWKAGENTQAANMLLLIDCALDVDFDLLLVIEDDEWYSPRYIECMAAIAPQGYEVFGESNARFYNARLRHARMLGNREHTALCRTGMNRTGALTMRQAFTERAPKGVHQDRMMWLRTAPERRSCFDLDSPLNVGIKGMPGRMGIGTGHDRIKRDVIKDPRMTTLTEWIGEDANHYARYYQKSCAA